MAYMNSLDLIISPKAVTVFARDIKGDCKQVSEAAEHK